jgi:RsmE family RNA methyltransferase
MNVILLEPADLVSGTTRARLTGRRAQHVREVHRARDGDVRAAGLLGGALGTATVVHLDATTVELDVRLDRPAPPPLPVTLVLALPRPKVVRRVVQGIAAIGVKRVFLVNAWRVEKSYWSSPALAAEALREDLLLGLEQGGDTILPEVHLRPLLRPFVEDELGAIAAASVALIGDGEAPLSCPHAVAGPVTLAIGPDGGFNRFEIGLFAAAGFTPVTLGPRALRVEAAVPAFLGRLSAV